MTTSEPNRKVKRVAAKSSHPALARHRLHVPVAAAQVHPLTRSPQLKVVGADSPSQQARNEALERQVRGLQSAYASLLERLVKLEQRVDESAPEVESPEAPSEHVVDPPAEDLGGESA